VFPNFLKTNSVVNQNTMHEFIKLNTYVRNVNVHLKRYNFSKALEIKNHIIMFQKHHPLSIYYLERNKNLMKMDSHFHLKILQVKLCNFNSI
jgi:hypothetical protein